MDYSVEAYLQRLTTEELETFLCQCMYRRQWDSYSYIIPRIIELLQSRNYPISQSILDSWEHYKQDQIQAGSSQN